MDGHFSQSLRKQNILKINGKNINGRYSMRNRTTTFYKSLNKLVNGLMASCWSMSPSALEVLY